MFETIFFLILRENFSKFVECSRNVLVVTALNLISTVYESKIIVVFYKFIKKHLAVFCQYLLICGDLDKSFGGLWNKCESFGGYPRKKA